MPHPFFERHRATSGSRGAGHPRTQLLERVPESASPKVYGEGAAEAGKAAFDALLGKRFPLTQPATVGDVGGENSPFGITLGVTYPKPDIDGLFAAVGRAQDQWRKAGPETWAGVSLEILARINKASFEIANAVMHTTGQAFLMAFQAGGPHAQDRGLEAVAYAWDELWRVPASAHWEKPQGKNEPIRMEKTFRVVPRGIGLVFGCCTFPTWNGYPGLFASLATGNAVIVKPHPAAILPLAMTVRIAREVLAEAGIDPNVVTLFAHEAGSDIAQQLALRPEVRIIDFTGSTANGRWLEEHARQAQVYTEKAGVNQIIVDGAADIKGGGAQHRVLAVAVHGADVHGAAEHLRAAATASTPPKAICRSTRSRRASPKACASSSPIRHAPSKCWAPCRTKASCAGSKRRARSARSCSTRRRSRIPRFPNATIRTPLIVKLGTADRATYLNEWFGPIAFVIATASTAESLAIARDAVRGHGALTMSVYPTNDDVIDRAIDVAEDAGVALSINLTGAVFVNQSAAFSDFHGTGANPAANASLTDAAYVASRFRVVQHRASHV